MFRPERASSRLTASPNPLDDPTTKAHFVPPAVSVIPKFSPSIEVWYYFPPHRAGPPQPGRATSRSIVDRSRRLGHPPRRPRRCPKWPVPPRAGRTIRLSGLWSALVLNQAPLGPCPPECNRARQNPADNLSIHSR